MARLVYLVTAPITADCFLRDQLQYLREAGHEVHLASAPGALLDRVGAASGVTVHEVPFEREIHLLADLKALRVLTALLRRLEPDVVHASTPKAGLLGMLAARRAAVPHRLYLVRGLRLETAKGFKRWLLVEAERRAARAATRVFCVSDSLRERYLALELDAGRTVDVLASGSSNGVSTERFASARRSDSRAAARRTLELPADAPVIGFVGRLTADKGVGDLVAAFRDHVQPAMPHARLVLIGDFESGSPVDPATRQSIDTTAQITVVPFIEHIASEYAAFDVVAFPTYREGFPNVPLEAAACGLPVVGYRATGTVDAVVDGTTGTLVEVGDVAGLGAALLASLGDSDLRRAQGAAGLERVRRDFAQEAVWQAWRDLYAELRPASDTQPNPGLYARYGKRLFDLALVFAILPLALPLAAVLAVAVRLRLGRPILFGQERPGRDGKPFRMYKFRTMTEARDVEGRLLPDDQRLTAFGRWMRRSSLDEIPELWHVITGHMSFVGPRPLLPEYLPHYNERQARRHDVRPGITGWSQINGRNSLSWKEKLELDIWYVENLGPVVDLGIIARTVMVVLTGGGVSAEGHSTMPRFKGTQGEDS